MVKQIIILLNLVGVIGFNFFFQENVVVQVNAPSQVEAGGEFTVELTVKKGSVDGFAKLQQALPEGFTAERIETSNATYSFKDQIMKCIWMALPPGEEFKVSYKVTVGPSVSGTFDIEGSFSYIENNEKQEISLPRIGITVGDGSPAPATAATPTPSRPSPPKKEAENGVFCSRTISPVKGKDREFKVEIKIQSDKEGFAKLEEYIPEGFTASEIESLEGLFSFKNQAVKIIWMALPPQKEFIIAYKLMAGKELTGNQKIEGAFSYIEGNETHKFELTPSNIFIEKDEEGVATIIIDDEGGTFQEKEELSIPQPEDDDEQEKIASTQEEEEEKEEPVSYMPAPDADVIYKVQIAAGHKSVPGDYFEKKYKLDDKIAIENHEGWIKYTIGSFPVYKDGRDHRNQVWNQYEIKDAFVTAYNYGNRITVQEALMITNQKWYN